MGTMRVFLADDHAILREGLRHILIKTGYCEVVGEAGDGQQALEQIEQLKPDMVILDISMPAMTGIEIARRLRRYHPDIKIIILSRHDNEEYVTQLLKFGIHGYVLKDDAGNDLIRAIEAINKNETYLSPRITKQLMTGMSGGGKKSESTGQFTKLTNREREVLKLIAEGNSNSEIAKTLWISPQTVKIHRQNMMKKLDIHKVADLVKYAIKSGIIET